MDLIRSAKVDMTDQPNLARSAKVDAIGQVDLIGKQALSPSGSAAGRDVGALVIMKRERAAVKPDPSKFQSGSKFRRQVGQQASKVGELRGSGSWCRRSCDHETRAGCSDT